MAATDIFENELLALIFQNDAIDKVGDASGLQPSGTAGSFYITLHTATLTDTSTPSTSIASYTGYAAKGVARTSGEWTVSAGTVSNTNAITFAQCTGGSDTVTDYGICDAASPTELWIFAALDSSLAISSGVTAEFAAADLDVSVT